MSSIPALGTRTFEDSRDHAMLRVLTEGVRRAELVQIRLHDLPADLIARPYIRVVPPQGARAADEGRIVPLTLATAKAIVTYRRGSRTGKLRPRRRCGWGPATAGR
jgi:integrase